MPDRDEKGQGEDSPKQAGSCWFDHHCSLATTGANLYPPGVWLADAMSSFSDITFVLFRFRPYASIEAVALRLIVLRHVGAPTDHVFFFFSFVSLEMSLFSSIFGPLPFSLCMESTYVRFFLPGGVFLPCD